MNDLVSRADGLRLRELLFTKGTSKLYGILLKHQHVPNHIKRCWMCLVKVKWGNLMLTHCYIF